MLEGGRKPICDQDPALMQSIRSAASERGTGNLLSFKNRPPHYNAESDCHREKEVHL